jgi:hypothetical protein
MSGIQLHYQFFSWTCYQLIIHFSEVPDSGFSTSDVLISIKEAKSAADQAREGASAASIAAHEAFITAQKSRNAARVLLQKTISLVDALEASQEAYERHSCESSLTARTECFDTKLN